MAISCWRFNIIIRDDISNMVIVLYSDWRVCGRVVNRRGVLMWNKRTVVYSRVSTQTTEPPEPEKLERDVCNRGQKPSQSWNLRITYTFPALF
jgi:hypothetical protein